MTASSQGQNSGQIHRVDKFVVPDAARAEFVERVRGTHEILRTLPGFVRDSVLEKTGGSGEVNFVTVAVWCDAGAVEAAREVVRARHEEAGFSPQEMFARLGITADLAAYEQLDV